MKTAITIKKSDDGEHYIDINDFKDIVDIDKVEYYKLESKDDGTLIVTFYDNDKNIIKPREA